MRTTIRDVAEKAGLSVATVSLVLNNKPSRISEATKEYVRKVAKEMDYRPSQLAVNLKKMRSNTIGLIVSDIRNSFYSSLAKGIEDKCRENGWNMILCNTNDLAEREKEYIEVLYSKGVEGIVLGMASTGSYETAKRSVELMHAKKIPFVLLDRSVVSDVCNAVVADHEKGGYAATRHLLELGHRRIACVTGPAYLEGSSSRLAGYRKAFKEFHVTVDESLIVPGEYTYESGVEAAEQLKEKDFSAVFAFNDMMTYGVCQGLRKQGKHIPDDVSVVGYDDSFFSQIFDVSLTMVRQPFYEMGKQAGEILIDIADHGRKQPSVVEFQSELIIRSSTKEYSGK